ncbi:MAG: hypothetical protein E7Z90_06190 [Cyanobacteria bacterium SIG29]|nr:hypothetical protein [Cyanobacteria bacterium SIG29]
MKVGAINNVKAFTPFKSSNKTSIPFSKEDKKDKMILALTGLAALGIAAVGINVLRENGIKSIKDIKKSSQKIVRNFNNRYLSRQRGKEALERYHFEEANRKLNSLHKRVLNGEFKDKSPAAMKQIRRNEIKLAQATGRLRPELYN